MCSWQDPSTIESLETPQKYLLTSLKACGIPKIPAPMNEMKMLAKILMEFLAPSSWCILYKLAFISPNLSKLARDTAEVRGMLFVRDQLTLTPPK